MELCFYSAEQNAIIDIACEVHGVVVSQLNKQTLTQMQERYPDTAIMSLTDAIERKQNRHKTEPAETTKESFLYMLEVLPPVGWRNDEKGETFKVCERISGNITSICARKGKKYYTFNDSIFLSHEEILNRLP